MRSLVDALAATVFLVCVVLVVVATSLSTLLFDPNAYLSEQLRQGVPQTSGIGEAELRATDGGIVRYFSTPRESLPESLSAKDANPDIFNERELVHMEDVRSLIGLLGKVQQIALVYAIIFLAAIFGFRGLAALGQVGRLLLASAGLMVGVMLIVGLFTILDFDQLFLRFHLISFSNDFWLLDPRTDNLIRIFPFEFWYNIMVTLVVRCMLGTGSLVVIGAIFSLLGRRMR